MSKMSSVWGLTALLACVIGCISSCNSKPLQSILSDTIASETASGQFVHDEQKLKVDTIVVYDTIYVDNVSVDSLNNIIDSLEEDNMIKTVRLERIKQYNIIAGKGRNIVFLRGWINRALKE